MQFNSDSCGHTVLAIKLPILQMGRSFKKSAVRNTQSVNQYPKTTQMLSLQSEIPAVCISFDVLSFDVLSFDILSFDILSFNILQSIAILLPNVVWIATLC